MKEAYRLQKFNLQDRLKESGKYLALFFIYTPKELPLYDIISQKMCTALQRLEKMIKELPANDTNNSYRNKSG